MANFPTPPQWPTSNKYLTMCSATDGLRKLVAALVHTALPTHGALKHSASMYPSLCTHCPLALVVSTYAAVQRWTVRAFVVRPRWRWVGDRRNPQLRKTGRLVTLESSDKDAPQTQWNAHDAFEIKRTFSKSPE